MGRPLKTGLDYFALDTDLDDKIHVLEAEHGLEGFAIFIKLLQQIYKNGYFYPWNKREQKLFSNGINVDINIVSAVINVCINEELFDRNIYEKHNILTSRGIQKRYFTAVGRRKVVDVHPEFLLIEINDYINPSSTRINVCKKYSSEGINVDIGTQSKLKKSKAFTPKINDDINSSATNTQPPHAPLSGAAASDDADDDPDPFDENEDDPEMRAALARLTDFKHRARSGSANPAGEKEA